MLRSLLLVLCAAVAVDPLPGGVVVETIRVTPPVGSALIVGRAVCGGTTWLLTEQAQLIQISDAARRVSFHALRGHSADDHIWGLACLEDGTLWTLVNPYTLARITADGVVRERVELPLPRLVLFGVKDQLLFVQLPLVSATPLLSAGPPRRAGDVRAWPGIFSRAGRSRPEELTANLVNCGVSAGNTVPCWLPDEDHATLSDGMVARQMRFGFLRSPDADASAPIWDIAVTPRGRLWVLATTVEAKSGRRVGGRLIYTDASGVAQNATPLAIPARIIVSADDRQCLLLSTKGDLMRVAQR